MQVTIFYPLHPMVTLTPSPPKIPKSQEEGKIHLSLCSNFQFNVGCVDPIPYILIPFTALIYISVL